MFILLQCIAGIKQKRLKKDAKTPVNFNKTKKIHVTSSQRKL